MASIALNVQGIYLLETEKPCTEQRENRLIWREWNLIVVAVSEAMA